MKRSLILLLFLSLHLYNVNSQDAFYSNPYFFHTVERGQTVYSISKMYDVTEEFIYRLNPGSEHSIQIGAQLKIPQSRQEVIYHTIEPKETLYSVSKKYGIRGEEIIGVNPGLSIQTFIIGRTIRIPLSGVNSFSISDPAKQQEHINALLFKSPEINKVNFINVAVLLPFGTKEKMTPEDLQPKIIEYYEGLLLALDSLKRKRISVNMQVFDIGNGTQRLKEILQMNDLKVSNLIIGGFSDDQIKLLSDFSSRAEIPYVVPFTSKSDEILRNPYLFLFNTPAGYLYAKAAKTFLNKYKAYNVIFLHEENADRVDFVRVLRNDLVAENRPYKTITYSSRFFADLESALAKDRPNVLVPSSESKESLLKILPGLMALNQKPGRNLSLFGYPRWHTYDLRDLSIGLYELNTTIFTNLYVKQNASETHRFYRNFYRWYSRPVENNYPAFGILGFDTGMFFIQLIHQYGTSFEPNVNSFDYEGIQTNFFYQRVSNWGGFVNANVFFVNYNPDLSVTREAR